MQLQRFEQNELHRLLKLYGVRSGALWYFRGGLFREIKAEKPPYVYLQQQMNGDTEWAAVNDLATALLKVTGMDRNVRVHYEGPSDLPRMYMKFEANDHFGIGDERLTEGVFLRFQLKKGGKYYSHWSVSTKTVRLCELIAIGRKSGEDLVAERDRYGNCNLVQHLQNVIDYRSGILA